MITVVLAFVAMLTSALLSGFRSRSIASGLRMQAAVSGALQTLGELIVVVAIVKQSSVVVIASSTIAAGLGYYLSMVIHDRLNAKFYKAKKKERKQWVDRRIEKRFKKSQR